MTSREMWQRLKEVFQSKRPARKDTLLKMTDGRNVRVHQNGFFDSVDKWNEMDVEINTDLLMVLHVYSLSANFENLYH